MDIGITLVLVLIGIMIVIVTIVIGGVIGDTCRMNFRKKRHLLLMDM